MSWLPSLLRPLTLPNTGSTARDHLALERTFLASVRTSLTLVSFGIALAQFFRLPVDFDDKAQDGDQLTLQSRAASSIWNPLNYLSFAPSSRNLDHVGKPLGASFILLGILVLVSGAIRFFQVQNQLIRNTIAPSRWEGEWTRRLSSLQRDEVWRSTDFCFLLSPSRNDDIPCRLSPLCCTGRRRHCTQSLSRSSLCVAYSRSKQDLFVVVVDKNSAAMQSC